MAAIAEAPTCCYEVFYRPPGPSRPRDCSRLRRLSRGNGSIDDKVFLDIQQVLPLPEAADYQVKVRRKEAALERARTEGRDFTRYSIVIDGAAGPDLNKRRAILAMVKALFDRGVSLKAVNDVLPPARMLSAPGELHDTAAIESAFASPKFRPKRFFLEEALIDEGHNIVSKMWGRSTDPVPSRLEKAFPDAGVSFKRQPAT